MKKKIINVLKEIPDPETQINIVDMGFIYDVKVDGGKVKIVMTLTTPLCPFGSIMQELVREQVRQVTGVKEVMVELTFDPLWTPEKINQEARSLLGW